MFIKNLKTVLFYICIIAMVFSASYFGSIKAREIGVLPTICIVEGTSMEPTMHDGEKFLEINKNDYNYNDIISFHDVEGSSKSLVKRIVGMPGDEIKVYNFRVWVNGVLEDSFPENELVVEEGYEVDEKYNKTFVLADNEYFVLGDNRKRSRDSRTFGPVTIDKIEGVIINH